MGQDETGSSRDETKATDDQVVAGQEEVESPPVEETRRVRLWVRVPTEGFLPGARWPLLAFLVLLGWGVLVFARGSVEGVVRERVRTRLAEQWLGFASVEVSGQNVVLRGAPPAASDGDRALLLAERTTCSTLFGELDCTVDVRGEFQAMASPPAAARPTAEQAK